MCRNVCTQLCAGTCARLDVNPSSPSETRIQSPRQQQKGQRACLFIPNTKNNTPAPSRRGELFNYKYQGRSRLRPTRSPSALCQAKQKINLLCGEVGKPQPNKEMPARCHSALGAHGSGLALAGGQGGVLFTSRAVRERGLRVRAGEHTHTPHTHTHTHRRVCVGTPSRDPAPCLNSTRAENRCVPGVNMRP